MFPDINSQPTKPTRVELPSKSNYAPIHKPVIKVMGLGGGGSNAVDRMIEFGIKGVDFIVANTDNQALAQSSAPTKIQLGKMATRGLGSGGNPAIGEAAAQESWREISEVLAGADMVFLTAGMGGGTGTGSIPIAARIARQQGAVGIAVVTLPFSFELGKRQNNAVDGLAELREQTDTLISIPNDRLLSIAPKDLPLDTAFRLADDVLRQAVQGITELITTPGLINVDFSHVRNMMKLGGGALMAIGHGEGDNKAFKAIDQALNHPLLDSVSINKAAGIITSFTASEDLSLMEISNALTHLQEQANPDTEIIMGATHSDMMRDRVQVILIVTGLGTTHVDNVIPGAGRKQISTSDNFLPSQDRKVQKRQISTSMDNLDLPAFLRR